MEMEFLLGCMYRLPKHKQKGTVPATVLLIKPLQAKPLDLVLQLPHSSSAKAHAENRQ